MNEAQRLEAAWKAAQNGLYLAAAFLGIFVFGGLLLFDISWSMEGWTLVTGTTAGGALAGMLVSLGTTCMEWMYHPLREMFSQKREMIRTKWGIIGGVVIAYAIDIITNAGFLIHQESEWVFGLTNSHPATLGLKWLFSIGLAFVEELFVLALVAIVAAWPVFFRWLRVYRSCSTPHQTEPRWAS